MDQKPDPKDVPDQIVDCIKDKANWERLCDEWDKKYPANPVNEKEDEGEAKC